MDYIFLNHRGGGELLGHVFLKQNCVNLQAMVSWGLSNIEPRVKWPIDIETIDSILFVTGRMDNHV